MQRYRFVSGATLAPTKAEIQAAETITKLSDILEYSKAVGEYQFTQDADLTKEFRKAKSVEIVVESIKGDATKLVNRVKVELNGKNYRTRLYGNKESGTIDAKTLTAEEIKKAVWGFCTSDGEKVTETKSNGFKVVNVPVIYLNIA